MTASSSPFPPGSSLASYLRDSGGNNQDLSVPQQRSEMEAFCQEHGHVLTRVFADEARPGGSTVGRDEFKRMVEYFLSGAPEAGVLLWDYSRFVREYDDGQYYLAALRRKGYIVFSLGQPVEDNEDGRLMESIHLWKDHKFRKELSRNVKRGLDLLITVYKAYPRPYVPPGYRKYAVQIGERRDGTPHIIHRLEPDPDRAPLVRRAFELRASGRTFSEIQEVTHLRRRRQDYQAMFHNEIYRGIFNFGGRRYENHCEPIVPEDVWNQVQEINRAWSDWRKEADEQAAIHPRRSRSPLLLSGVVRCAACGWTMVGLRRPDDGFYYRCAWNTAAAMRGHRCRARLIREEELDQRVVSRLLEFLEGPEYLQAIVDALREALARVPVEPSALDDLRAKLLAAETGAARIADALEKAPASETLLSRLAELEQQARDCRAELARIEADERKRQAAAGLDAGQTQQQALAARIRLESPDFRSRQLALRGMIKEVRVLREKGQAFQGTMTILLPGTEIETNVIL